MGTRVNSSSINASSSGATAYTVALGVAVATGDLIVISAGSQGTHAANGMAASMTATAEAFTTTKEQQGGNASSRWLQSLRYQATQAFLSTDTITFTPYAASTQNDFVVDIFRGWTSTIDQAAVGQSNASGTNTAPALAGNAIVGALVITCIETASGTLTAGTPFSTGSANSTTQASAIGFVLGATGSLTYGSTWTVGTAGTNATITVSFQAAAAAAAAIPLQGRRGRLTVPLRPRTRAASPPQAQALPPPQPPRRRWPSMAQRRGKAVTAVPPQVVITPPAYPPASVHRLRLVLGRIRGRSASPVPPQVVVAPPAYPPSPVRGRRFAVLTRRGRAAGPPQGGTVPPPPYGSATGRRLRQVLGRIRGKTTAPAPPQTTPTRIPAPARPPIPQARPRRASSPVPPQQVVVAPPAYPPQPLRRRVLAFITRRRGPQLVPPMAQATCTTPRPGSGTTAYTTATTAYTTATTSRPDTGGDARPNTGTTSDPC